MQLSVHVKLTPTEKDVLDWLMARKDLESRSQTIRLAIREVAERLGINRATIEELREERYQHLPRRSTKIARLIGRRERNDRDPSKIA